MPQFIGTSMPRGFAGQLTRGYFDHTTEAKKNDATAPVAAFGVPVKINSAGDGVAACSAKTDAVYGFSVRVFGTTYRDAAGKDVQDMDLVTVLRRGYIAVAVASGTPKLGGKVYLTTTGTLSADANDGESSPTAYTEIPGCTFCGAKDADGLAEIAFNI